MRITCTGAVLLLLAGCGGAAPDNAGNAPAVSTDPTPPAPAANQTNAAAPAAEIAGARALIDRLYGAYARGDAPAMEDVLTYDLERALARTADPATSAVQDPLCQCSERTQNFRYTIQSLELTRGGATAQLAIANRGTNFALTLKLRPDGARWQIEDVINDNGSLLNGRR